MKNNILKVVFVNLLIFCFFLMLIEAYSYHKYYKQVEKLMNMQSKMLSRTQQLRYTMPIFFNIDTYRYNFRYNKGSNPHKKPVLFLGCSYTAGEGLDNNQKFDYKVSKTTGRSTYSRAISGGGPQHMYYDFKTGMVKKEVPEVGVIVYTFVPDHVFKPLEYRMSYLSTRLNVRYAFKDGELREIKPFMPIMYSSFFVKRTQDRLVDFKYAQLDKEGRQFEIFNALMKELMRYSREYYPNSKFVILEYPSHIFDIYNRNVYAFPKNEVKYLEGLGFIVINAKKLTGEPLEKSEYRTEDNDHPNEKAWDAIVPKLVKILNL